MKTKFFDDLDPKIENFVNISEDISRRIEEILKIKQISKEEFYSILEKTEEFTSIKVNKIFSPYYNFSIKLIAEIETILGMKILQVLKEENKTSEIYQ